MFCHNCGKEVENDSLFCSECGAKQELTPTQTVAASDEDARENEKKDQKEPVQNEPVQNEPVQNEPVQNEPVQNEPVHNELVHNEAIQKFLLNITKNKKLLGGVIGGVVVLCLLILLASVLIKPTINLNKYVTVTFDGYDAVGEAVFTFDDEKFEKDYEKKLSKAVGKSSSSNKFRKDSVLNSLYEAFSDTTSAQFLNEYVSGSLDKDSGLSNGDRVTFSWDCEDEGALEDYGYKLKYKDIEYKVSGLEEAEAFDPFDGIEVTFEGTAPNGKATISGQQKTEEIASYNYSLDVKAGLKNGDTVKVTLFDSYEEPIKQCISQYGKVPSSLEKEYKVKGLDSYVTSLKEVSSDGLDKMKKQAEDEFNASVAKSWGEGERLDSLTYLGAYLLTNKEQKNTWGTNNSAYLVYKASINNSYTNDNGESYDQNSDMYWYISYNNLLINSDGEMTVDVMNYRTPSDRFQIDSGINRGFFGTKTWSYYGYDSLGSLHESVVTKNIDSFNYEDNIKEEPAEANATE